MNAKLYTAATPEMIHAYRESTGASMYDAKKHFANIEKAEQKAEMLEIVDNADLGEIRYLLKILIEAY